MVFIIYGNISLDIITYKLPLLLLIYKEYHIYNIIRLWVWHWPMNYPQLEYLHFYCGCLNIDINISLKTQFRSTFIREYSLRTSLGTQDTRLGIAHLNLVIIKHEVVCIFRPHSHYTVNVNTPILNFECRSIICFFFKFT